MIKAKNTKVSIIVGTLELLGKSQ